MAVNLTNLDISTRYALQEDFNNGFVGRDRQVVIQTDDPKGYRPVIMDGTTQGGKSKVALLTDLSDYVSESTYNSDKEGFETTAHASATYATKSELSGYLPLAGGTLTGTVNGVTPSEEDNSTKLATTAFVQTVVAQNTDTGVPAGTLLAFAGTDVPKGYLLCNGANVSRTTYAALFAVIGTKYGEGDGSSTFTLPNLDGRVLQGTTDTGEVGNYLEPQLPNITGSHRARSDAWFGDIVPEGAFFSDEDTSNHRIIDVGSGSGHISVGLNASLANELYSGDKLQVSALSVLVCIKT